MARKEAHAICVMCLIKVGKQRHTKKGIVKGESRGENKMALLVKKLLDQNRIDDVKRASEDEKSRAELMKELGIN